jgi:GNAT superfamily N-acetyltransferase
MTNTWQDTPVRLRAAEPERDFGQLAAWFSDLEDEPTTESGLTEWYEKEREWSIQRVAEDEQGELLGFYWATRDRLVSGRATFFLFVKPERRGQGIGRRLYEDLVQAAREIQVNRLQVSVWETCPEGLAFAQRRGFTERRRSMAMVLNLDTFDDRPYDEIIIRLKGEGFRFTSMQELGNTEEAQRKLYALNDTTSAETPGTDGEHTWGSFEDFQERVCQSDWYKPAGQMVVIDTATGVWAAMSAITRLEGVEYAYNLFTGVDSRYRGRKLAQAVKVLALRYARDVLGASTVRTHHNTRNLPMIAIDRKLGYVQMPGTVLMEKIVG